jgi:hypothetical protein
MMTPDQGQFECGGGHSTGGFMAISLVYSESSSWIFEIAK